MPVPFTRLGKFSRLNQILIVVEPPSVMKKGRKAHGSLHQVRTHSGEEDSNMPPVEGSGAISLQVQRNRCPSIPSKAASSAIEANPAVDRTRSIAPAATAAVSHHSPVGECQTRSMDWTCVGNCRNLRGRDVREFRPCCICCHGSATSHCGSCNGAYWNICCRIPTLTFLPKTRRKGLRLPRHCRIGCP